jgi:WD40 repeat protein
MYGPTNDITMLCSSPDGHLIAAAEGPATTDGNANKGRIWVWDARGRELHQIGHQLGSLQAIQFGPNGKYLIAVGSYSTGHVVVWDMFDSTQPCASSSIGFGAPPIHAIDMLVPAGGKDAEATVDKRNKNSDGNSTVLSFVSVGGRTMTRWKLVATTTSGAMQLVSNRVLEAVAGHGGSSHQAEYFTTIAHCNPSPNTYRFAVGGGGGSVWLVTGSIDDDTMSVRMDSHWSALDGGLDHVSWREAGDSKTLVVAGISHLLQTWTVGPHKAKSTQQPTKLGEWQLDGHVLSLTVDTRARDAVVATDSGTIWYVNNTTGRSSVASNHDGAPSPLVRSHTSPIEDISCAADGTLMATAGGIDGTIRIWHLELLQTALTLDCARCTSLCFPAPCVAPMGGQGMHPHVLAAGNASGTVTYFDLAQVVPALPGVVGDRVAARRVRAHGSSVTAMSYIGCTATDQSPQRVLLVSGSATGDIVVTGPSAGDATSVILDSPHAGSLIQSIEVCPFDPTTWLIASRNSGLSVWRCEPKPNLANRGGDEHDNEEEDEEAADTSAANFVCTQLTYVLLRKLVEGSSPFDGAASASESLSMTSARETVAHKCPTLATFSPCESSVILCTTASHPFVILFYNYAIRQVVRTVALPQWQWATSLSATVTLGRKALIAAGLRSGRLALIDYRSGQTSEFDDALQGTPVGALGFCQPQSILCAASNNVVHVWKTA